MPHFVPAGGAAPGRGFFVGKSIIFLDTIPKKDCLVYFPRNPIIKDKKDKRGQSVPPAGPLRHKGINLVWR